MSELSSSIALRASSSAFTSISTSISSSIASAATTTPLVVPDDLQSESRKSYLSSTITSLVACLTLMLGLMYIVVLSWAWRYSMSNPRALNKTSGVLVQRHAPSVYIFLVLSSLAEVAISSWLALQYRFNHDYPNIEVRTGVQLLLFTSCWTCLTAGAYSLVFLHSDWSKHPIASIGAQAVWILVTWLFWIAGAGILNTAASSLLLHGRVCVPGGIAYCGQIRALFGIAVVESFMLAAGMSVILWLAWQSTRYVLEPASFPMR